MESSSYCWQCPSLYMKAPVSGLLCQREGWRAHPSPLLLPSGHAPLRPTPGPRALLLPCPRPRGAFGSGGARGARGARGAGAAAGRKFGACPGALRKLPKMRKRRALGGRCDFGGERREEEELATRAAPQLPRGRARRAPDPRALTPHCPAPASPAQVGVACAPFSRPAGTRHLGHLWGEKRVGNVAARLLGGFLGV